MKFQMFSVYDRAVNCYLPPFFCRTQGEAIRSFTEAVNDPNKSFGKYATDYALMGFGEFDDNSGSFLTHDPVRIIAANEVIEMEVMKEDPPDNVRRMPM
ncbi:nonstructural protein [robinz microvirus RP_103]|nr:nonstructural protein [robinz microvirus RP_103]